MRGLPLLLILAFLAAGCTEPAGDHPGDGDGGDDAGDQRPPKTWDVNVTDNRFEPAMLTIQVGDTVRWTHTGGNPHTVTAEDSAFDSHPDCNSFADSLLGACMEAGDTYEHTFEAAGEVPYVCKVHASTMMGTIDVVVPDDTA